MTIYFETGGDCETGQLQQSHHYGLSGKPMADQPASLSNSRPVSAQTECRAWYPFHAVTGEARNRARESAEMPSSCAAGEIQFAGGMVKPRRLVRLEVPKGRRSGTASSQAYQARPACNSLSMRAGIAEDARGSLLSHHAPRGSIPPPAPIFSRADSAARLGDNRGMAATSAEGTAPNTGSGKCGVRRHLNSPDRNSMTAGKDRHNLSSPPKCAHSSLQLMGVCRFPTDKLSPARAATAFNERMTR